MTTRILVVDDEPFFLDTVVEMIEDQWSMVECLAAPSAQSAIDILAADKLGEIKAVVCDLNMPDGPGSLVFAYLRSEKKDLPFCFLSGGTYEEFAQIEGFEPHSRRTVLIEKPFEQKQLIEFLRPWVAPTEWPQLS